jgi:hypothetical protein
MVATAPDWRWLLERSDTPWYPTMRLFRQTVARQWGDVMDRVAAGLRDRFAAEAPPAPPTPTRVRRSRAAAT